MNRNLVSFGVSKKRFTKYERAVREAALLSLKVLGKNKKALDIFLVPDGEMKKLNRRFRGRNKVTDVLSFPADPPFPRPDLGKRDFIGEIFLAPDFVETEKEDIRFLTVHATLHLLGYTHSARKDSIMMNKLERKIWPCRKY